RLGIRLGNWLTVEQADDWCTGSPPRRPATTRWSRTPESGGGVSFMAQFAQGEGHESRSRRRPHDHLERAARGSVARAPDRRESTYPGREAESEGAAATAARRPARLLGAVGERIPQVLAE